MNTSQVRTAIFPVAGRGTRMLPATRAVPKELLPVLDTPLIDFAIDEARAAGIKRLIFVTHPDKEPIRQHIQRGLPDTANEDSPEVIFVDQTAPLGLGHAVLCAQHLVLPGPVAVVLPDDLILGGEGCLSEMVEAYARTPARHLVASMQVPRDQVSRYGILAVANASASLMPADTLVEKPQPEFAPSNHAVVGRYILDPVIFDAIAGLRPGAGGEIQLTDAIAQTANEVGLAGFAFSGQRFDCGSKRGLFQAIIHRASQNPDFADVLAGRNMTLLHPSAA